MRPLRVYIRNWKRKIRKYTRRNGYNPLRAIVRERERRKYVRLGMRLARQQEPKSPFHLPPPMKPQVLHVQPGDLLRHYNQEKPETPTQVVKAINAATARELQRHLDERKSGHYEPPEKHTDRISQVEINRAILHACHLRRIQTHEMPGVFPVADTDKFLI